MLVQIEKSTLLFLHRLSRNNNREWFQKHKDQYLSAQENMISFADCLLVQMQKHDHIETMSGKNALMRIYRDTRFSKDKTPYKTYMGGGFRRATKRLRGGYYFHVAADGGLAAGGFFGPNRDDLLRIRKDIDVFYEDWRKVLGGKKLNKVFGKLKGSQLVTAPRGFPIDHPGIDLLRFKQFYFERRFSKDEVLASNFVKEIDYSFQCLRPYFNYMSEVLTTDTNGVSLVD